MAKYQIVEFEPGQECGSFGKLGATLKQSVDAYNRAVGSLERQVLPSARRFTELGVRSRRNIEPLAEIDTSTREPAPAEVVADTEGESR